MRKVGDVVVIKSYAECIKYDDKHKKATPTFVPCMEKFCNKIMTIMQTVDYFKNGKHFIWYKMKGDNDRFSFCEGYFKKIKGLNIE